MSEHSLLPTSEFWDARYSAHTDLYGALPNAFFAEQLALLPPGTLLLPCDGEGRNAISAALAGWDVESFDSSTVATERLLARAAGAGVAPRASVADALTFTPSLPAFTCVALIYAHLPPESRAAFHRRAASWVAPGGTLLLEAFHPAQLGRPSGGPRDASWLYSASTLRDDFAGTGLTLHTCTEQEIDLDEGPFHRGPAAVVRLIATRPA